MILITPTEGLIMWAGFYPATLFAVGVVARNYGRRVWPWVLLAMVLGIFTFIPLVIAGTTRQRRGSFPPLHS